MHPSGAGGAARFTSAKRDSHTEQAPRVDGATTPHRTHTFGSIARALTAPS
jgi:hypothetical protein